MQKKINIENVERKVFVSYFSDGMWDIYGGLILSGFGLSILTGQMILLIVFIAIAMVPILIRKPIVASRLGSVTFSIKRERKTMKYKTAAWIAGSLVLVSGALFSALYSFSTLPAWLDTMLENSLFLFMGAMLASIACIAGYATAVRRFYAYAIVVFLAFGLAAVLRPQDMEGIPITAAGGLILLTGIIILIRFLRNNPNYDQEADR
ncbi:MAG: hypothetical protein JW954_05955 [Dehalococcoidaceae bacterium]|nr:hypothetical protein [Dehalococcoidaceae bacterium]